MINTFEIPTFPSVHELDQQVVIGLQDVPAFIIEHAPLPKNLKVGK